MMLCAGTCPAIVCAAACERGPPALANGEVTCAGPAPYPQGTTCDVKCNEGYARSKQQQTCTGLQTWDVVECTRE